MSTFVTKTIVPDIGIIIPALLAFICKEKPSPYFQSVDPEMCRESLANDVWVLIFFNFNFIFI